MIPSNLISPAGPAFKKQDMLLTKPISFSMRLRSSHTSTCILLFTAASFLYCFLFIPPFLPIEVNDAADSLLYLAPGQRMYQGEMIYRDFFEFVTPGTALVHFFLFKFFGLRPWIPNLLVILLGLSMVWLGVVISRKLMRPSLALLPSAFFIVSVRFYLCDPTHHWYSALAAIAAIAVMLERRTPARIAAAGILCGISACFTQTRGLAVVVGFAVFLWWESRQIQEGWRVLMKKEARLAACFLATFLAVNAYFIWTAGLKRYLWCTVVFVLKYYPKEADWNTFQTIRTFYFPALSSLHTVLHTLDYWTFLIAVPLIFILFFLRYWRESSKRPLEYWAGPMLVAIVGLFMLLCIAPSPNPNRMSVSALPALILLGWLLDSPRKLARGFVVLFTVGAILIAAYALVRSRPHPAGILVTPQGRVAFADPTIHEEYIWIQQHTHPSDYFYEANVSDQYFYLDLRNPTPLPRIVNNGYTTREQVAEVIRGLEQHQVRYIFWGLDKPDDLPEWENPSDARLVPLWSYMQAHYTRVMVFPDDTEIWKRVVK